VDYFTNRTEESVASEPYSEEQLSDLIYELIRVGQNLLKAQSEEKQFHLDNPEPVAENFFESVEQLVNFNNQQARYEQGLRQVQDQLREAKEHYKELCRQVGEILPRGSSLDYDYARGRVRLRWRYKVTNDDGTIRFERHMV
jgi:hypothetical protein